MLKIVGLSGSLREGSYNRALLKSAQGLLPDEAQLNIVAIDGIPLYNADVETRDGVPNYVEEIKNQMAAADALLVSTPEYNNGIPGVLKNAIDWISRPGSDHARVFHGKAFGLMGASPGGFGTINAQTAWLPLIRYFKLHPCFKNSLYVSKAHEKFDDNLSLIDEAVRGNLKTFLEDFVLFAQESLNN